MLQKYRSFCESQPGLPIYYQPWYLDGIAGAGGWDVLVVEAGSVTAAIMPFTLEKRFFWRMLRQPMIAKMSGPYLAPDFRGTKESSEILNRLIAALPAYDFLSVQCHYSLDNWMPFSWAGFEQTTKYSFLLDDLTDIDQVAQGINRNMRRNIRKAAAQLQVVHDLGLQEFYRLAGLSMQRKSMSLPYSFEQLQKHDESLASHHARQLFFAVDDLGQIHSAACLMWDRQSSYFHIVGDDPALRSSGSGILLIWEAVRYTVEELKLTRFDFEGSMLPEVAAIRRQFGAQPRPYFHLRHYRSKMLRILDAVRGVGG